MNRMGENKIAEGWQVSEAAGAGVGDPSLFWMQIRHSIEAISRRSRQISLAQELSRRLARINNLRVRLHDQRALRSSSSQRSWWHCERRLRLRWTALLRETWACGEGPMARAGRITPMVRRAGKDPSGKSPASISSSISIVRGLKRKHARVWKGEGLRSNLISQGGNGSGRIQPRDGDLPS